MKDKQRRLSHEEKSELFKMYETGKYSMRSLANYFPITESSIISLLRRNGYKAKSASELKRKYPINEHFFDKINTEEKAYILGLLYADGYNNTDRNSVSLVLKESDKEILEKITAIVQPTKPLLYIDTSIKVKTKGFENSQNQWKFTINNKHISERLVDLGCGKAKTHNLTFPTEEQVPKLLQRHFIRGYFDGDGSVSGDKQKQISFIGTIGFLKPLQQILMSELGFSKTKLDQRHTDRNDEIRNLRYGGLNQCIQFRDWLYEDTRIFMKRKKDVFDTYIPFERVEVKCSVEGCDKKHLKNSYCSKHHYKLNGGSEVRKLRYKETGG